MASCSAPPPSWAWLPGAERLPGDAAIYVATPDRAALLARLDASSAARAASADPAWAAFAGDTGLAALVASVRREAASLDAAAEPGAALCGRRNPATGRWSWTALARLKGSASDSDPRPGGSAWTAIRGGLLIAAADEDSLRAFLAAPPDPPRALKACAPRPGSIAAGEAFVFLALERWAPAALSAWHLRLADLDGLGLRVAFDASIRLHGTAAAAPGAYRELLDHQVRAPRRDPRPPAGASAVLVQSGPLARIADRIRTSAPTEVRDACSPELALLDRDLRRRGSSLHQAVEGTGWALALVPDGDAVPSAVAVLDLGSPERAADLQLVLRRLYERTAPPDSPPGPVHVTHLPGEPFESRAAGRHVFLWRSSAQADPPATAGLLQPTETGGLHGLLRVSRDSAPLLARELGPVAELLHGPDAGEELRRTAESLRWIRSLEIRTLWGDRGAEIDGTVEIGN